MRRAAARVATRRGSSITIRPSTTLDRRSGTIVVLPAPGSAVSTAVPGPSGPKAAHSSGMAASTGSTGPVWGMRKFVDDAADDHRTEGDDKPPAVWSVAVTDDCEVCDDLRVVLTVEPVGEAGRGTVAHLSPDGARRLQRALAAALKELGQPSA